MFALSHPLVFNIHDVLHLLCHVHRRLIFMMFCHTHCCLIFVTFCVRSAGSICPCWRTSPRSIFMSHGKRRKTSSSALAASSVRRATKRSLTHHCNCLNRFSNVLTHVYAGKDYPRPMVCHMEASQRNLGLMRQVRTEQQKTAELTRGKTQTRMTLKRKNIYLAECHKYWLGLIYSQM